jgi:hypothetical protein
MFDICCSNMYLRIPYKCRVISKFKICIIDKKYTKFVHLFKELIFIQL